jgi:hypothetical protein
MHRRAASRAVAGCLTVAVLAACGSSDAASPEPAVTVGGVGALPGTLVAPETSVAAPETTTDSTSPDREPPASVASDPGPVAAERATTVGRRVDGNRVLVIGDSILASISARYGGQLCDRLVPRGWAVEVDAEVGRFIEFGRRVLDRRLAAGWDAAVVMLGNNYDGDPVGFGRELDSLLDELAPMPVVLVGVTRFEPKQDEVNYVLSSAAQSHDDVVLVDWTARTAEGAPGAAALLTGDGLHLSAAGQAALAAMISGALGSAPRGSQGECLDSSFDDDAAGSIPTGGGRGTGEGTGGGSQDGGGSRSGTGSAGAGAAVTSTTAPAARPAVTTTTPAPRADVPVTTAAPPPRADPPVTAGEPAAEPDPAPPAPVTAVAP